MSIRNTDYVMQSITGLQDSKSQYDLESGEPIRMALDLYQVGIAGKILECGHQLILIQILALFNPSISVNKFNKPF